MKTAKVAVTNPKTREKEICTALLDTGARRTYITMEKAKQLGLKYGPSKLINLSTFGSNEPSSLSTNKTNFIINQSDGSKKEINARICKTITGNVIRNRIDTKQFDHIWKGLKLADDPPTETRQYKIDILIGNDYYDEIMKTDKIEVQKGLYLINSSLGWMFSGRVSDGLNNNEEQMMMMMAEENINLEKAFWNLETIGINLVTDKEENMNIISKINENIVNKEEQIAQLERSLNKLNTITKELSLMKTDIVDKEEQIAHLETRYC